MKVLVLSEPVERARFAEVVAGEGFVAGADVPWTNGIRYTIWTRGEDRITFATDAASGAALVRIDEAEGEALGDTMAARFPGQDPAAVIAAARAAGAPRDRIRTMFRAGSLTLVPGPWVDDVVALLGERLSDGEPLVRWAAAHLLGKRIERRVEQALTAAAEVHPDLEPAAAWMRALCAQREAGTLYDEPTDAWHELVQRAREGAAQGQWKRVVAASEALLEQKAAHAEGLFYRALAHAEEGELVLALALVGASVHEEEEDRKVRREVDERERAREDEDDEDEAENEDDDDYDDEDEEGGEYENGQDGDEDDGEGADEDDDEDEDDYDDDEDDEAAEDEAAGPDDFLTKAREAREVLRARVAALEPEARRAAVDAVLARIQRLGSDGAAYVGAAEALRGVVPELDALAGFLVARYRGDAAGLAEARERVPGSPSVLHASGRAASKRDRPEARRHFEEALRLVREGARSPEAERVEAFLAAQGDAASEATILEDLTRVVYESEAWDDAARLADELVRVAPDATSGWQIRALARTFAPRHEEAVVAYDDALRELARIYQRTDEGGGIVFGTDPRPTMRFNRSCVLAKLGRRDEALEDLRRAVRLDAKWADRAGTDDYWQVYWQDPDFLAITSRDPKALVTAEERDPEHLRKLVRRAKGLAYSGKIAQALEAGERAAELAGWAGETEVLVEALSVWGRTVAFEQDVGRGLDLVERAWALAEPEGAVSPPVRAEAAHERAVVLHLARQWDRAEEAYERALALRRAAYGGLDPVLAKSYGDLARLQSDRGAGADVVIATIDRGVSVLERFLEGRAERDAAWAEAALDLATLRVNRVHVEAGLGERARAAEMEGDMEKAVAALEEASAGGWSASPAFLENAAGLARASARGHVARIEALLAPGGAEERRERLYWRGLRQWVSELRKLGVEDAKIANWMSQALRGGGELPEALRAVPALAELPAELAKRAARYPTFVVMSALSLSTVESGGSLDEALRNLEELCVAQIAAAAGGEDDEEDDDG